LCSPREKVKSHRARSPFKNLKARFLETPRPPICAAQAMVHQHRSKRVLQPGFFGDDHQEEIPARGSLIQIFGTGEGLTSPPGTTGEITGGNTKKSVQSVSLTIGGIDAAVISAGSAPNAYAGLFLAKAVVPQNVTPGPAVPIVLTVGSGHSQLGITVAVK